MMSKVSWLAPRFFFRFEAAWTSDDPEFDYSTLPEWGREPKDTTNSEKDKIEYRIAEELALSMNCNPYDLQVRLHRARLGSWEVFGEITALKDAAWDLIQIMAAVGGAIQTKQMIRRAIRRAIDSYMRSENHGPGKSRAWIYVKKTWRWSRDIILFVTIVLLMYGVLIASLAI